MVSSCSVFYSKILPASLSCILFTCSVHATFIGSWFAMCCVRFLLSLVWRSFVVVTVGVILRVYLSVWFSLFWSFVACIWSLVGAVTRCLLDTSNLCWHIGYFCLIWFVVFSTSAWSSLLIVIMSSFSLCSSTHVTSPAGCLSLNVILSFLSVDLGLFLVTVRLIFLTLRMWIVSGFSHERRSRYCFVATESSCVVF